MIVTAPVRALRGIEFSPALSDSPAQTIEERLNLTGTKVWFKVRGHRSFSACAPLRQPRTLVRSEYFLDDDRTIFVGFGPDRDRLDLTDPRQVQDAVRHWLPDVEVIESTGHDWGADPCMRQAWSTPRVRQFLHTWDDEFGHRGHRLAFASDDLAKRWNGFVDGAIESGLTATRGVHRRAHQGASVREPDHQGTETSMVASLT